MYQWGIKNGWVVSGGRNKRRDGKAVWWGRRANTEGALKLGVFIFQEMALTKEV